MSRVNDPPSNPDAPAPDAEPPVETDGEAIKKDLLAEEALEKDLLELEREAEELEKARKRRIALREREDRA
jgi:hypothetical protein